MMNRPTQFHHSTISLGVGLKCDLWSYEWCRLFVKLTCCGHQAEPHGRCWGWVGLRLVFSSQGEHWPGLGCIPEGRGVRKLNENGIKTRNEKNRKGKRYILLNCKAEYLECRPVHMHFRAMVVAEPLQVLLCVSSKDSTLQFSVYCGIAEERTREHCDREKDRRESENAANSLKGANIQEKGQNPATERLKWVPKIHS